MSAIQRGGLWRDATLGSQTTLVVGLLTCALGVSTFSQAWTRAALDSGIAETPPWLLHVLSALFLLLLLGSAGVSATPLSENGWNVGARFGSFVKAIARGARTLWPSFALGLTYFLVNPRFDEYEDLLGTAWGLLVLVAGCIAIQRQNRGKKGFLALDGLSPHWVDRSLLALVIALSAHYLHTGLQLNESLDNDSAYYFGAAKHIVESGRWEEPLVWQFLYKHEGLVHAPFDYWQGLSSIILVVVFLFFGVSHAAAGAAMALTSSIGLFFFWKLIVEVEPVRAPVLRILAVLLFGLSPALSVYRFDSESVGLVTTLMCVSLYAFAKGQFRLCVAAACLLVFSRGDGLIPCLLFTGASLYRLRSSLRKQVQVLGIAVGLGALYVAYYYFAFGTLGPPAARSIPFSQVEQQYDYLETLGPSIPLTELLKLERVEDAVWQTFRTFFRLEAVPHANLWVLLCVGGAGLATRRAFVRPLWLLMFVVTAIQVYVARSVFAPWRTFHSLIPAIILLGIYTLDGAFLRLRDKLERVHWSGRAVVSGAILWVIAVVFVTDLQLYPDLKVEQTRRERWGAQVNEILDGAPVMASSPWHAFTELDSPVVALPRNAKTHLAATIDRYKPEFLLLSSHCISHAESFCDQIRRGMTHVGPYRLVKVKEVREVYLFRISRTSSVL